MADVFVSCKREDHGRVAPLIVALARRGGLSVWRDKGIGTGKSWSEAWSRFIERELAEARCVLVIWSRRSLEAPWMHHNARIGRQRDSLLQAVIDGVSPPEELRSIPFVDLSQWSGRISDPGIGELVAGVRRITGGDVRPVRRGPPPIPDYMSAGSKSGAAWDCHVLGLKRRYEKLPVSAIAAFTRAIELDPGFASAYRYRAIEHYEETSYDRAIADCSTAIALHPEDAYSHGLRGLARAGRHDYDGAIADFDRAIALGPELTQVAGIYYRRGRAFAAKADHDVAIASYTKAIQEGWQGGILKPDYYFHRGCAYEHRAWPGDRDRAVTDYLKTLQGSPDYAEGYPATRLNAQAEAALTRLCGAR
jgi:hypothetical protein